MPPPSSGAASGEASCANAPIAGNATPTDAAMTTLRISKSRRFNRARSRCRSILLGTSYLYRALTRAPTATTVRAQLLQGPYVILMIFRTRTYLMRHEVHQSNVISCVGFDASPVWSHNVRSAQPSSYWRGTNVTADQSCAICLDSRSRPPATHLENRTLWAIILDARSVKLLLCSTSFAYSVPRFAIKPRTQRTGGTSL